MGLVERSAVGASQVLILPHSRIMDCFHICIGTLETDRTRNTRAPTWDLNRRGFLGSSHLTRNSSVSFVSHFLWLRNPPSPFHRPMGALSELRARSLP